jgi:hypothetical protein
MKQSILEIIEYSDGSKCHRREGGTALGVYDRQNRFGIVRPRE